MTISIIDPVGGHGGMDYYDYGLASGLGSNEVVVLYFTCANTKEREYPNVSTQTTFHNIWKFTGFIRLYYFLMGYLKSFRLSNKEKTKIFHFHFFDLGTLNFIVLLMAFFFRQKKVVTLHDVESFYKRSNKIVSNLCLQLIDGIIVHNHFSKNEFEKSFKYTKEITIIPHGNYLPFVSVLQEPTIDKIIKLLFFGQIKEVKGLDILLNAMAIVVRENPYFKLTIAGRPWKTDFGQYKKMIVNLDLVNFVESHIRFIEDDEVASFYENADVVVLPYKHIYQSGVLFLTLSYGRTVITSDLEPFKEVIRHNENGFNFQSENPEALASCILNLNQENILETTHNAAKLIKDKFDWIKIGQQTINFYNTL
ncbi:glycosyltransferase family 4 protein [uncultured Eudoraea sp.]|uniref:glycosyltransferase family 4 protein n=1 Tax=uncultured Eudoraea sp. TaxID=1035614 RepID=UPI002622F558|nr:glycosyltransferase family 4 protein [uncultured Eudoraea sp.]